MSLTELSRNELDTLRFRRFSPAEAREYIDKGLPVRRFGDTLRAFYNVKDDAALKKKLIEALSGFPGSPSRESVARKVRDWLDDKYAPSAREEYLKLCFALDLSETEAGSFLSIASDGDFHIRDPYELSCVCALRFGGDYASALAMKERIESVLSDASIPDSKNQNELTGALRAAFQAICDENSLLAFAREYKGAFGKQKNTAYEQFKKCITLLRRPNEDEEPYSVEEIMKNYLSMGLPAKKSKSQFNTLQKLVLSNWPDATSIFNMSGRKIDITRKVLALLFLITDGCQTYADIPNEDEIENEDEIAVFDDCYTRMKTMLIDCGFSPPDPRNVFDWLCIYCLKPTSVDYDGPDAQMAKVLSEVFKTEE